MDNSAASDLLISHVAVHPYSYNEETGELINNDEFIPDCAVAKICGSSMATMPNNVAG